MRCSGHRAPVAVHAFRGPGRWDVRGHIVSAFSINIVAKGEEIVYDEDGKRYCFEIFLGRQPLQLFAGRYWADSFPVVFRELTEAEKLRIIPRLVSYLGSHGEKVEVVWRE